MLRRVWAPSILLLASVLSGCSQPTPTPTPEATESPQLVAGSGWTLLRTVSPTPIIEGIAIAPLGADQYVVSVTVRGGGADGCGAPVFTGFQPSGATLLAQIVRSPASDSCAVASAITFYVALDRVVVPDTVVRVAIGDNCEGSTCTAQVPRPS